MMGINFEKMSKVIHKHFDTDYIDIFRKVDGFVERQEIYSNISCNIEIKQSDNPDPTAIDVTPIISSLIIHMPNWVDVRNNDYIVAKKMSHSGEILHVYRGVCGEPAQWQSRKTVNMTMESLESDKPVTPPPPQEQSQVLVYFRDISDDKEIRSKIIEVVEQGKATNIYPLTIENHSLEQSFLDGQQVETGIVTIENPKAEGHEVIFKYSQVNINSFFRILTNGVYTKDNGSLGYGLHLYSKIPVLGVSGEDGNLIFKTRSNKVEHEEIGIINFSIGTKIKTNLGEWLEITTTPTKLEDGTYMFETKSYVPTEQEQNAYETHWYD